MSRRQRVHRCAQLHGGIVQRGAALPTCSKLDRLRFHELLVRNEAVDIRCALCVAVGQALEVVGMLLQKCAAWRAPYTNGPR